MNPSIARRAWKLAVLLSLGLCVPCLLVAGSISGLNVFQAGTTAVAADVNANFTAVSNAVNDNNARIGYLEDCETPINLTGDPTIAVDGSMGCVFDINLTGNRTLANPTGAVDGRTYTLRVSQDATGGHGLNFASNYVFSGDPLEVLSGANEVTVMQFHAKASYFYLLSAHAEAPVGGGLPDFFYFTNAAAGKVQKARLDGSELTDIATGSYPVGIAADIAGGKLYWGDVNLDLVKRSNLDGTGQETLPIPRSDTVEQVALDLVNQRLFVAKWTLGIYSYNLNGQNEQLLLNSAEFTSPAGIALDVVAGKIYMCILNTARVWRANLDGSNPELLLQSTDGLSQPRDIDLDLANGKMYIANRGDGRILRANLDGTNLEEVVTGAMTPIPFVVSMALDLQNRKVYWTDASLNVIKRADMDTGANSQTIISSGLSDPWGIFIDN